jgi:hypothetical protein
MSYINLLTNDIWSEADIINRGRAEIESVVPAARQSELQTILLGHIAGMRTATADELQEIGVVQYITEQAAITNNAARADMALLQEVINYETDPTDKVLSAEAQVILDLRHPITNDQVQQDSPQI